MLNEVNKLKHKYNFQNENGEFEKERSRLERLETFILKGDYTDTKNKKVHLEMYLQPVREVASVLGVQAGTVSKARSRIDANLKSVLGDNIVSLVEQTDTDDFENLMDYAEYKLNGGLLFVEPLTILLNNVEEDGFDYMLEDCVDEINYIRSIAKPLFSDTLEVIDRAKLAYVLQILGYRGDKVSSGELVDLLSRLGVFNHE